MYHSDEDASDQDENALNKRQGGYNIIKPDLKCEIECVGNLRNPESGQGMSIKEATKACKNICLVTNAKRAQKMSHEQRDEQTRERSLRVLADYLMEQMQLSNDE